MTTGGGLSQEVGKSDLVQEKRGIAGRGCWVTKVLGARWEVVLGYKGVLGTRLDEVTEGSQLPLA